MEYFELSLEPGELDSKIIEQIVKEDYPEYVVVVDNPFDKLEKCKKTELNFSTDAKVDRVDKKVYVYVIPHIESA